MGRIGPADLRELRLSSSEAPETRIQTTRFSSPDRLRGTRAPSRRAPRPGPIAGGGRRRPHRRRRPLLAWVPGVGPHRDLRERPTRQRSSPSRRSGGGGPASGPGRASTSSPCPRGSDTRPRNSASRHTATSWAPMPTALEPVNQAPIAPRWVMACVIACHCGGLGGDRLGRHVPQMCHAGLRSEGHSRGWEVPAAPVGLSVAVVAGRGARLGQGPPWGFAICSSRQGPPSSWRLRRSPRGCPSLRLSAAGHRRRGVGVGRPSPGA